MNAPASGLNSSVPGVGEEKIGTPSTPRLIAVAVVTGMWKVPASADAWAASIWRSMSPLTPPNWPRAVFMWDASESFIQIGTYWFTMTLRNVRKTRRAMTVPMVEATARSSDRKSRIRTRMSSPAENPPSALLHPPILDDAIYMCRAENLPLRMSLFLHVRAPRFDVDFRPHFLTRKGPDSGRSRS